MNLLLLTSLHFKHLRAQLALYFHAVSKKKNSEASLFLKLGTYLAVRSYPVKTEKMHFI